MGQHYTITQTFHELLCACVTQTLTMSLDSAATWSSSSTLRLLGRSLVVTQEEFAP